MLETLNSCHLLGGTVNTRSSPPRKPGCLGMLREDSDDSSPVKKKHQRFLNFLPSIESSTGSIHDRNPDAESRIRLRI
jgi:hypothetical protein